VEALIAEVSTDVALQYGIQFAGGGEVGNGGLGAGFTQFPSGPGIVETTQAIADAAAGGTGSILPAPPGLNIGILSKKITLPDGTEIRGLGALARAFANDTNVNVLSTPNLLTLDNTEANILVGQNVPFVTGSFAQSTGTDGSVNPFTTVEREDVGLKLKVKPQISEGGGVKLDIEQEVSSVILATALSANGPTTNKREIKTSVIVDDGNTIVLGGLIEDSSSDSVEKVPLLGDIPILGELFKFTNRSKKKTNLMVFLRPVIVRSERDAATYSFDRYDYIRASQPDLSKTREFILRRFEPKVPPAEPEPAAETAPAPAPTSDSGSAPVAASIPAPAPAP
jgi:general secretion pathway protein D